MTPDEIQWRHRLQQPRSPFGAYAPSPDVVRRKAHVRAWFDDLQVVLVRWYGMSAKDYARRGVRMESPTVLRFYEPLESEKGR